MFTLCNFILGAITVAQRKFESFLTLPSFLYRPRF